MEKEVKKLTCELEKLIQEAQTRALNFKIPPCPRCGADIEVDFTLHLYATRAQPNSTGEYTCCHCDEAFLFMVGPCPPVNILPVQTRGGR